MARLEGRSAIVTGAGSGIGRAGAIALAHEGAGVYLTDIDEAGSAQTLDMIRAAGGRAMAAHQDVTNEARWHDVMLEAREAHGPVNILVNNAGVAIAGPIVEFSLEDWQKQIQVNLDSVFLGTREAIRAMRATGGGSIINISSVAGLRGAAGASAYCASKGGVRLFTKAAAVECAQMQYGIRVNSVHPGIIDTPIWTKSITRMTEASLDSDDMAQMMESTNANALDPEVIAQAATPMGRAGRPEEIADAIVFLASEESSYMTGQEMVIDGALTAR